MMVIKRTLTRLGAAAAVSGAALAVATPAAADWSWGYDAGPRYRYPPYGYESYESGPPYGWIPGAPGYTYEPATMSGYVRSGPYRAERLRHR